MKNNHTEILMNIREDIGEIKGDLKSINQRLESGDKKFALVFDKLNSTENRSIKNEENIKNIYRNAGIIGGIIGFFSGLIVWIINRIWSK